MTMNYQQVTEGLRVLRAVLAPFVAGELRRHFSDGWWKRGVLEAVYENQRRRLLPSGEDSALIASLDAARCLQLTIHWWHDIFRYKLDRDARTWVHELISTRNRWAHAVQEDVSDEDAWRALDTMIRLVEPIDAKATASLRVLARTLRFGTSRTLPSTKSQGQAASKRAGERIGATGQVEVRDHVLWVKHIRDHDFLASVLSELGQGGRIELEVNGFRGVWEKMKDGRDGRPMPGIKPQGPARGHWHELYKKKRGCLVNLLLVEGGEE